MASGLELALRMWTVVGMNQLLECLLFSALPLLCPSEPAYPHFGSSRAITIASFVNGEVSNKAPVAFGETFDLDLYVIGLGSGGPPSLGVTDRPMVPTVVRPRGPTSDR